MTKKLNSILLVDDDEATNFIHKLIIEKMGCAEKVVITQNGSEALAYLKSKVNGSTPQPDIIFLDINMPGMNGWDFLEEYQKLDTANQGKVVLVMLTTSLNPDDMSRAEQIPVVNGFKNKPLTPVLLNEILEEYFPEYA